MGRFRTVHFRHPHIHEDGIVVARLMVQTDHFQKAKDDMTYSALLYHEFSDRAMIAINISMAFQTSAINGSSTTHIILS
jgi:hypothetical protein